MFKTLGEKPLLVVRGEVSDLLSAAALERMHAAVPTMKSVTLPGVGHAPELDEPKAIAAIDAFLDKLDRLAIFMPTFILTPTRSNGRRHWGRRRTTALAFPRDTITCARSGHIRAAAVS